MSKMKKFNLPTIVAIGFPPKNVRSKSVDALVGNSSHSVFLTGLFSLLETEHCAS